MAGRTPHEALENFLEPLQRVIALVTRSILVADRYSPPEQPRAVLFGGLGSPLIRGEHDLVFDVALYFNIVEAEGELGPWRCHTLGYSFEFRKPDGPSVLAYHWHPASESSDYPHPHIHVETGEGSPVTASAHVPTGRVSLEAVIRFAIEEMGVEPRNPAWSDILDESEQAFITYRSWG